MENLPFSMPKVGDRIKFSEGFQKKLPDSFSTRRIWALCGEHPEICMFPEWELGLHWLDEETAEVVRAVWSTDKYLRATQQFKSEYLAKLAAERPKRLFAEIKANAERAWNHD